MLKRSCLVSALAVFVIATSALGIKKPHKLTKLGAGVYLASEFDAATTYHQLQICSGHCYEANPMVRPFASNPGIFVALGASAYTVNYFARKLDNRGHHRWATAVRIFAIGAHVGAGVQNLAVAH